MPIPRLDRGFFRDFWTLVRPYWFSEERWAARGLFAALIGSNLFDVYLTVRNTLWFNDFYASLQHYDWPATLRQVGVFALIALGSTVNAVAGTYVQMVLQIRWRRWLTGHFLGWWLGHKAYYRLQLASHGTDNPDQRIQEDLDNFTASSLTLTLGFMNSALTVVSMLGLLWTLSGTLTLPLGAFGKVTLPGYGVWASLLYAGIGTWITFKLGRRLVSLNFNQRRVEADFRYSLVRLRENAESIAFYDGEPRELGSFREYFGFVYENFMAILRRTLLINSYAFGYRQTGILVPWVVALPPYFARRIDYGGYSEFIRAFQEVTLNLLWIVTAYSDIASFQATVRRLGTFRTHLLQIVPDEEAHEGVRFSAGGEGFAVDDLRVRLPDGRVLLDNVSLSLAPHSRTLLMGPSGTGKSTFLRAIARLWPFAEGTVRTGFERPMFLPQRPYLPIGTLRDAILYPYGDARTPDAELRTALTKVGLAAFVRELDHEDNWSSRLSGGEQQRINFARILVQHPDVVFMDEATSALDEPSEANIYEMLSGMSERPAFLSIGHRSTLKSFHDRVVAFEPSQTGAQLVEAAE